MKIYTRTGDEGDTGLFGGGRVPKSHIRVEAYGAVDELNSILGWTLTQDLGAASSDELRAIQEDLFTIGAQLATPSVTRGKRPEVPALPETRTTDLEAAIDRMDAELAPLRTFILPGGTPAGAALHIARTVCRRAERRVTALAREDDIDSSVLPYLNRLSDFLFTLARHTNHRAGEPERPWLPRNS